MLFSLLKHYLDTDTALKLSRSVYCFTTSVSHGVENYFPGCGVWASLMLFFPIFLYISIKLVCCWGSECKSWAVNLMEGLDLTFDPLRSDYIYLLKRSIFLGDFLSVAKT